MFLVFKVQIFSTGKLVKDDKEWPILHRLGSCISVQNSKKNLLTLT